MLEKETIRRILEIVIVFQVISIHNAEENEQQTSAMTENGSM